MKVPDEQPAAARPRAPAVPFHCGHTPPTPVPSPMAAQVWLHKSWARPAGGAPLVQSQQRARSLLRLEVVSSPALIADERWVILSGENARMP